MKKLLKISTVALILFSFIATSCEKENAVPPPPPVVVVMTMETTTSFTAPGATKPTVVKGDIEEGVRGVVYTIVPKLNVCNCAGTWSYTMAPVNNPAYFHKMDIRNGAVSFTAAISGTYVFTITYKCPDGSSVSTTATITIK